MKAFPSSFQTQAEKMIKKIYSDSLWIGIFTKIRFRTGCFVEVETYVPKKGTILDLGTGYGILGNYVAACSKKRYVIGIDTDKGKIKKANRDIKNTRFYFGNATKMNLKNLHGIILHDVLHHLNSYDEQEVLIRNCKDMLTKNGTLLIVEIDKKPFWKLVLTRLSDFIMYKGDPVYYRYQEDMKSLLLKYFSVNKIAITTLHASPFSQILYICQK